MKLVQARIPEVDFRLLRRRAKKSGKTIQAVVREALRGHLLAEDVDPKDRLWAAFPLGRGRGGRRTDAERHDELLYGARE